MKQTSLKRPGTNETKRKQNYSHPFGGSQIHRYLFSRFALFFLWIIKIWIEKPREIPLHSSIFYSQRFIVGPLGKRLIFFFFFCRGNGFPPRINLQPAVIHSTNHLIREKKKRKNGAYLIFDPSWPGNSITQIYSVARAWSITPAGDAIAAAS